MLKKLLFVFTLTLTFASAQGQSPAPVVVVQAATDKSASPAAPLAATDSSPATLKLLQEMKAANDEVLKKQLATLQTLDDLEKAAEQLKIFSKRG